MLPCLVCITLAAQGSSAQTAAEAFLLDDIIVNARKIEEPLATVPFSVSPFTGQDLQEQRIDEAEALLPRVPNATFTDFGVRVGNIPSLRGVGSFIPISGDDTSLPVYIDGVPLPARSFDRQFFGADQIEVLRGPQGTLFGRNAQAGAVSIFTADPTDELTFRFGAEVGNRGQREASAIVSGPLGAGAAGILGLRYAERDGNIDSFIFDGLGGLAEVQENAINARDVTNAFGKLRFDLRADTTVTFAGRLERDNEAPNPTVLVQDERYPRAGLRTPFELEYTSALASLTVEHQFDFARLTSITGYTEYESDAFGGLADSIQFGAVLGAPPGFINFGDEFRRITDEEQQFTQEIRLDGGSDEGLRWVLGAFYLQSDFNVVTDLEFAAFADGTFESTTETRSASIFGEGTWRATDRLRLSAGLRFTEETKDYDIEFTERPGGPPTVARFGEERSLDFSYWSGRVGLTYDFSETLFGYASVSRGVKSGGLQFADNDNANGIPTSSYDTAVTLSYEAGLRGSALGGALNYSASVFLNETSNEHIQAFDLVLGQFEVFNADTRNYGVEIEANYAVSNAWTLQATIGLMETEIVSADAGSGIEKGNRVPLAPDYTVTLAAQYDSPLPNGFGALFGRAEVIAVGTRAADALNSFDLDSYEVVNLQLGWYDNRYSVTAFVSNLFDEDVQSFGVPLGTSPTGDPLQAVVAGAPQLVGIRAEWRF